jgi:hypothetical protein
MSLNHTRRRKSSSVVRLWVFVFSSSSVVRLWVCFRLFVFCLSSLVFVIHDMLYCVDGRSTVCDMLLLRGRAPGAPLLYLNFKI